MLGGVDDPRLSISSSRLPHFDELHDLSLSRLPLAITSRERLPARPLVLSTVGGRERGARAVLRPRPLGAQDHKTSGPRQSVSGTSSITFPEPPLSPTEDPGQFYYVDSRPHQQEVAWPGEVGPQPRQPPPSPPEEVQLQHPKRRRPIDRGLRRSSTTSADNNVVGRGSGERTHTVEVDHDEDRPPRPRERGPATTTGDATRNEGRFGFFFNRPAKSSCADEEQEVSTPTCGHRGSPGAAHHHRRPARKNALLKKTSSTGSKNRHRGVRLHHDVGRSNTSAGTIYG